MQSLYCRPTSVIVVAAAGGAGAWGTASANQPWRARVRVPGGVQLKIPGGELAVGSLGESKEEGWWSTSAEPPTDPRQPPQRGRPDVGLPHGHPPRPLRRARRTRARRTLPQDAAAIRIRRYRDLTLSPVSSHPPPGSGLMLPTVTSCHCFDRMACISPQLLLNGGQPISVSATRHSRAVVN